MIMELIDLTKFDKILLYSLTKGVKQKYLLYIYCIGSAYTNIDKQQCSIYTVQSHNWLTSGESILLPICALLLYATKASVSLAPPSYLGGAGSSS